MVILKLTWPTRMALTDQYPSLNQLACSMTRANQKTLCCLRSCPTGTFSLLPGQTSCSLCPAGRCGALLDLCHSENPGRMIRSDDLHEMELCCLCIIIVTPWVSFNVSKRDT
jgi:hypothetical protein